MKNFYSDYVAIYESGAVQDFKARSDGEAVQLAVSDSISKRSKVDRVVKIVNGVENIVLGSTPTKP